MLTKLGHSEYGNLAVSLCLPLAFLVGGGLMPTLIGWIGDVSSIGTGFLLVGILMAIGGCGCLFAALMKARKLRS